MKGIVTEWKGERDKRLEMCKLPRINPVDAQKPMD